MKAVRIQRKRTKGFDLQAASLAVNGLPAVCVDRSSGFGNPFSVRRVGLGRDGKEWSVEDADGMWFFYTKSEAHDAARRLFSAWIALPKNATLRQRAGIALRDRNLACFCGQEEACHADVWLEILLEENEK